MQGSRVIEYQVMHRPAVTRRIHLETDDRGNLRVVAPRLMSRRVIQETLQRRVKHVARFLDRARDRLRELPAYHFVSGERHPFLGRQIPLEVTVKPGRGAVALDEGRIRIAAAEPSGERIQAALQRWYRRQAQALFEARLALLSAAAPWTGGRMPAMRMRWMKRTWGSCSASGVITLNPHLVKAPPACIDYVIAHEVCHLEEHNHGKAFYALQERLCPDWRESKAALAAKSHLYLPL